MMPSHAVGTKSTPTPMSSANCFATSISKPISSPFLSRIAQGTKVARPIRRSPRFLIVSSALSADRSCRVSAVATPESASRKPAVTSAPMPSLIDFIGGGPFM